MADNGVSHDRAPDACTSRIQDGVDRRLCVYVSRDESATGPTATFEGERFWMEHGDLLTIIDRGITGDRLGELVHILARGLRMQLTAMETSDAAARSDLSTQVFLSMRALQYTYVDLVRAQCWYEISRWTDPRRWHDDVRPDPSKFFELFEASPGPVRKTTRGVSLHGGDLCIVPVGLEAARKIMSTPHIANDESVVGPLDEDERSSRVLVFHNADTRDGSPEIDPAFRSHLADGTIRALVGGVPATTLARCSCAVREYVEHLNASSVSRTSTFGTGPRGAFALDASIAKGRREWASGVMKRVLNRRLASIKARLWRPSGRLAARMMMEWEDA